MFTHLTKENVLYTSHVDVYILKQRW